MNKTWLIITLILSIQSTFSQKKEIKNTIKINTIGVFKKIYDFQYEKVLNEKNSIQFGIGIGKNENNDLSKYQEFHLENFGRNLNNPKDVVINENTFSINVDYRHYYMKSNKAPRGLYLSPSIQYLKSDSNYTAFEQDSFGSNNGTFNYTKREYISEVNIVNVRALIGCQLMIANIICLNPYFGPSYAFGSAKAYNGNEDSKAKGILLNYGIYLGFGF